jgi:tetratricopeptide (TPR) repeat protein
MRKIIFLLMTLVLATSAFAQKRNIDRAESKMKSGSDVDLKEAQAAIESAMKDPTTAADAKTYVVAGNVYYKFYEQEEVKRIQKKDYSQKIKNDYLVKALNAYQKAAALDEQPDSNGKIKPKYTKELKTKLSTYSEYLYNEGVYTYQNGDYEEAVDLWKEYLKRPEYPLLKGDGLESDTLRNKVRYFSIDAANRVPELKPVAIQYMHELIDENYEPQVMYQMLYREYFINQQDTVKTIQTLKDGLKKYPDDMFLLGNLINIYIYSDKAEEALVYLNEAIKNEPNNSQLYTVKGNVLLRSKRDFDGALKEYLAAIKIDPSNASAQSGIGLVYITKAEEIMDKANSIRDNNKYKAEKNRATKEFEKAIEYLEKARQLDPNDMNNLSLLRAAYLRIDHPNYTKIDEEINAKRGM